MKDIKRVSAVIERPALSIAAWCAHLFSRRSSPDAYKAHTLSPVEGKADGLRVTFLGVSTLLFEDGETAILTDGFFTRPSRLRTLFTRIEPDHNLIARYLERAGIEKLKAVIVLHSHLDHAFDAPIVAWKTDAELIGSGSTAKIGLGYEFPGDRIKVIEDGEVRSFGRFQVKWLRSEHSPLTFLSPFHIHHVLLHGNIEQEIKLPARWYEYKEGGSYSVLIEHDGRRILVQASAGFKKGALSDQEADAVFLGIGTLGKLSADYQNEYWDEVVGAVNPRRVIPIHWDDFTLSLDRPLVPMSGLVDDFDKAMEFLLARGRETGIEVKILPAWVKVDPFGSF